MILALMAAISIATCPPVAGADVLLADSSVHWIVVGEIHGTEEMPAIFADLVCLAGEVRRPIVVAIEHPATEQAAIDAFLASNGDATARSRLMAGAFWHGLRDGRSSRAFVALLDRLRIMKQAHRIASVVAFQPVSAEPLRNAAYEAAMAGVVKSAKGATSTLVLTLVGNIHARLAPWAKADGTSYMPMAGLLPAEQTRTLDIGNNGGSAWICFGSSAPDAPLDCGPHDMPAVAVPRQPRQRGLVLLPAGSMPYSGRLDLGTAITASPPAVP